MNLPPSPIRVSHTGTCQVGRQRLSAATAIGFAAADQQGRCELDASNPDGTPRKLMNVDRLNAMGWTAKTGMREGLAVAYRDFLAACAER